MEAKSMANIDNFYKINVHLFIKLQAGRWSPFSVMCIFKVLKYIFVLIIVKKY